MAAKLLNLLAVTSLAIVACSFGVTPANALSANHNAHAAKSHLARAHGTMSKKKRSANAKRCKTRPASSSLVTSSTKADTSSTKVATSTKPADVQATTSSKKATSTKAPAATTAPAAPPVNSGSGKVGIAWANGNDIPIKPFKGPNSGWTYTWSPYLPAGAASAGLKPVPMLWGAKQVGDFTKLVKAGYADHVLGPNEPDQPGQSTMSAGEGAAMWKQYIEPLAGKGYTLISPAVSSSANGLQWFRDFMGACGGCTIDRVAIHWYGTDANDLIAYVKQWHTEFGKPIWLTEYACQNFGGGAQCSSDQVWSFTKTATAFLDGADYVEAYFPFGAMHDLGNVNADNQLMAGGGGPNDLGNFYINH